MNKRNILTAFLLVIVFSLGFILGRANIQTPFNSVADSIVDTVENGEGEKESQNEPQNTSTGANTNSGINVSSNLTDGQRKMLESFGLNPDEFTITPTMIACAEAKLGAPRIAEIEAGATPSMLEGASLVACYK